MPNNNDLSILIKILMDKTSKTNITTEVENLISQLQKKIGTLNIKIGGTGLSQLISQLNQISSSMQNIKTPNFDFDNKSKELLAFNKAIMHTERNIETTGRRVSTIKDELGKVTMEVTSATGYVEKYKYQWDSVSKMLIRINREQKDSIGTVDALQAKFKGLIETLNKGKLGSFVDKSALKTFEDSLKGIEVLDKKILTDLQNQFNQIKKNAQLLSKVENSYQSQLNKLNPKVISSDKMAEQIKLMPIGTKEVDEAKRKVETFQKYLYSLDLRIKKGEVIPQETFRILNRYEAEVKRVIKNTQDMVNNSGSNTKKQKIFDFNIMTSELAMFKSEIEKMKSSLSVGGNVVNKSSIDEFGKLTLEIRNQAGYIEKLKFQWDSVSQSLRKVNIEQSQNNDALKTFKISSFKSIADISKNYKGFITKDEIKNLVDYIKNIEVLDTQTRKLASNRISNLSNKSKNNSEIQDLEHKLLLYKKIAEFESKNARTRYGSNIDKSALDAYLSGVGKLNSSTDNLKKKMKELDVEYRRIVSNARTAAAELNNSNKSFMELFRIAMQRFPIWMAASTVFYQSFAFFKEGIQFVNEYNKSLTELSMVYMKTQEQIEGLGEKIHALSIQMGIATQEVAKGAVEFARQGLSQEDTFKRMETAIKYAKISNLDFNTSARILTATVNSMGVSAEHAADVFSYMGDATATGADEIGEAFQRMGGTIGSTDVTFAKAASWVSIISAKSRESAYTIGNSIKGLISRMQSLKERGFDETDGTQVNQVAKSLATIGVQLIDNQGQFRNFGKVMDEIGGKWKTLDSRQKAYVSTTLAGTYQQARFLNLMESYGESIDLYKESLNQAGIANKKFDLYQQGTEAQLTRMKNVFEGVWLNTFSSDGIRNVISALTGLGNIINYIIKTFGASTVALGITMVSFSLFSNVLRTKVIANGATLIAMLKGTSTALNGATLSSRLATIAFTGLSFSIRGVGLAMASTIKFMSGLFFPLAIITTISFALTKLGEIVWDLFHKTEKAREEFNKLKDELKSLKSEITETETLLKTYEDLSGGLAKTTEEKEKLAEATQRLSELYPEAVIRYNAEGKAIENNTKLIEQYLDAKRKEGEEKKKALKDGFIDTSDADFESLNNSKDNINKTKKELDAFIKLRDSKGIFRNAIYSDNDIDENIVRLRKELRGFQDESNKTFETLSTGASALYSEFDNFDLGSSNLTLFIRDILNNSEELNKSGVKDIRGFIEQLGEAKVPNIFAEYNKALEEYKESPMLEKDYETLVNKQATALSALEKVFKDLKLESSETFKQLKEDFLALPQIKLDSFTDYDTAIKSLTDTYKKSSDEINEYQKLLSDVTEGNDINFESVQKLIETNPKLITAIKNENGQMTISVEALRKLIKERKLEHKTAIETQIEKTKIINKATLDRIKSYGIEIEQIHNLADAEAAVVEMGMKMSANVGKMTPEEEKQAVVDLSRSRAEIEKSKQEIENYKKLSQELIDSMDNPNFGIDRSKDSNSTAESLAWEEVTNEIKKYDNALNRLEDTTSNMIKGSKDRRDALHAENLKIKEQIDYLKKQKDGLNTVSITTTSNGKLPNPIPGKELKDSFGAPRDGGARKHEGIDIMAERGTEIHSTTSGKVLSAGNTGTKGGWGVTISDPQGNRHYYAHMNTDPSKILGIGQEILAGQVIGYVGDSGNAKGTPHLHYGITDANKKAVNPYNLLTNDVNTTTTQKTITTNTSRSAIDRYNISPEIVDTVLSLAQKYNVDPALILAIGEQETNWGKSGDGKKGMYLGYGSYDSGSDYSQAGLENQVEKAIKKMSAWGMTPGNVSFDKLNQGNQGNLPTGIYATDGRWQNSVWNLYKEFSNGQMTSTISGDSSNLSYAKLAEDRIKHQEEINAKILELEKKFAQNSKEWYTDLWQESDNIISEFEQKSNFSKMFSESMSKSSPEYRNELEVQKNNITGVQTQLAEQAKQMDQAIENMKKGITEGTFKDEQFLKETIEKRKALSAEWWNKQKEIVDKQAEITSSEVEAVTNKIDEYNLALSISQSQQEMNENGTEGYNNALKNEAIQYANIEFALKAKLAIYQKELADTALGTLRYQELQKAISDTTQEIINNEKALYDKKMSLGDNIISIYKDAYEKQKDYALDAIDKQMDAEDKRHEQATKNIESEMNQFEDFINEKLDLLNDQENQEDYTQNLNKLQKEESDIQKQINKLALDDSYEANAKRFDLQKELTVKQEEIEKLQTDRSRELRKENLQDQLDIYKKDNDAQKELEDDKYDTIKDSLDDQKDITEKYYDNLINDERKFAQIREDIIKGNFGNIQSELSNFENIASSKFKSLGTNIQTNFIDQIRNALSALKSLNDANGSDIGGNSGSSDSSNNNNSSNNSSNHSKYYPWKTQINNIIYDKKMWQQGYETGNQQMMKDAENEAKIYYDQIPDDAKSLLQGMNYTSAKSWYDKNIYHEGGLISNTKPSKIMDIVNKLFNTQSNESVVKMLKGELAIPENNVMKNFMPNMQNFVSSFVPSFNLQPQAVGGGNTNITMNVNIAKVNTQDQSSLNQFFGTIRTELNKIGK